ncbi:putative amino acid permease-like protein [Trypanosoma cruzi]|uniref:Amino acid permease-like protein, putative n=2 Tax=Trypanosoma cruzi TaxID=5693 RepID=Q4CSG3_TRYCC|nr:amino acid permease-like protein, putative [Trypanosoma cruzi]EAN83214.1 amino acid permease-like protein, putative [Trypanosoma cruzi]PWV11538.1 putative amino acid permease-like protein [Trypanosoma cruzi]RNC59708.1 putative amino acid permease-like protein [Trypanosoma cruzi]|eukprot:XP_805065.1 amino acid permease-like protein [Trypanosoma cruzi strain CL Brener]
MSQGGVLGSALILAVTTIGAGILTLPSAFSDAGVVLALVVLILVALLTVVSIDYMVICIDKLGVNSYEQINRELFGRYNEEFVRWMLLVYNTGSAISYLVILGELIEPLQPAISLHFPWLVTTKHTLFVFWIFVILPLSCVPDISFLRGASFLAIAVTCFISSLVVVRYFVPNGCGGGDDDNVSQCSSGMGTSDAVSWFSGKHPLLALPIMMFSFDCQSLVFQVYSGLKEMNRRNMMRISVISLLLSGTIHAAVGMFGYLGHPTDVRENVMSNFDPTTDTLFAIGYFVYVIPVNLAFVIILFPTRDAIFLMWYGYSSATEAVDRGHVTDSGLENYDACQQRIPARDHLIVSVSLSVTCLTAALLVPGVVSVVALLGGVCSSSLCFTYPALYRLRLHKTGILPYTKYWERPLNWIMLIFGLVGGVLGTIVAAKEFF